MFSKALLADLFAHMEWADATVWKAVLQTEAALADTALRGTLVHLQSAQHAFLDVWRGNPFRFREDSEFADLHAVRALAPPYYAEARQLVDTVDAQALGARLILPWLEPYEKQIGRTFGPTTLGETVYQVIAHANHHRGQVNTRLRALGGTPPTVDYIVWIFFGRPAADWGAA